MVKLYTAALLTGAALSSLNQEVAAVVVSSTVQANNHLHIHLKHKSKKDKHKKGDNTLVGVNENDADTDQAAYEQQVLEAAQKDPELMAALQSAAKEAADEANGTQSATQTTQPPAIEEEIAATAQSNFEAALPVEAEEKPVVVAAA